MSRNDANFTEENDSIHNATCRHDKFIEIRTKNLGLALI